MATRSPTTPGSGSRASTGWTTRGGCFGGAPGEVIGFRPEDLLVDLAGDIDVTVSSVEPLGSETVLWVHSSGGSTLAVRVPPRSPYTPGLLLRLSAVAERRHVFDAATGVHR